MVKFCDEPAQLPDAVTVIVATTTAPLVLVAVNAAIFPLPDAARPIDVLLFVQLNGAPVPVKLMAVVVALLHTVWLPGLLTVPPGLTVIVRVDTGPKQLLACGVTVNTPLIGEAPAFVAVNDAMEVPEPPAPIPMPVLLLAQVNVVPVTLLLKSSALVLALLHTLCDVGVTVIIGVGFTFTVNVCTGPKQLFAWGVTVNAPLVAVAPVLVAVNDTIELPEPLAPIPIAVLLLAHVYVDPLTLLVNISALVFALLHTVCEVGDTDIIGVGFTVIIKLVGAPEQLLADGVTVIVEVIAEVVPLVAVKEAILPLPLALRPIEEALFVQL